MKTTSRIFRAAQLPAELTAEWERLLLVSPTASAFLSPTYSAVSDRVLCNTQVCVIEAAGEPQAFFPFATPTRLARLTGAARPVSAELTDYVGLICRDGFRINPETLLRQAGIHSFLFTHLDSSLLNAGLSGEQPRPGLTVDFSNGVDAFRTETEARDKSFVRISERRSSKLARDKGGFTFALHYGYNKELLDLLIEQKIDQYRRTQVPNPLESSGAKQFLHALAQLPESETCAPMFSTLHCGQTLVASHLGLRCGDTLHYWFPVYDPAFGNYSPGRTLIWEMISHAAAAGMRDMDFGEGDTPAKRNFANREHTYYRGFYSRRTPQGIADRALMALCWRLERVCKKS